MIQKILIAGPIKAVCVIGTCYCRSSNVSGVSGSVLNPSGRQVRGIQQEHSLKYIKLMQPIGKILPSLWIESLMLMCL